MSASTGAPDGRNGIYDDRAKAYRIEGRVSAGHASVANSRRKRQLMTSQKIRSGGRLGYRGK